MIDYDDSLHKYSHKGKRYTSATQVIEQFKMPFNTEGIAAYIADKRGGTADYWKREWKEKNKRSLVRGSAIHDAKESLTLDMGMIVLNGKSHHVRNYNLLPDWQYLYWPDGVYTELIVWNHQYKCAGRADRVLFETINNERWAFIGDYKTGEVIRTSSFYTTGTHKYEMLLPPVSHIMACNYEEYTLQLSLYAFMLEEMGFKIGGLTLEHEPPILSEAPNRPGIPKPEILHLKYRRDDVILMLQHINKAV